MGFQSVIAAIGILIVLLLWSKLLSHLSALDAWKRNSGWLLATAVEVLGIALIPIQFDTSIGKVGLIGTPTSLGFWAIVAVAVTLTVILLNVLRRISSGIRT